MSSLRRFHSFAGFSAVVFTLAIGLLAALAPAAAQEAPERRTPRGTMAGFLEATGRRDYTRAAEYLDLSRLAPARRAEQGPALAHELRIVIDQAIPIDLDDLSDQPAGSPQEGLPPDQGARRDGFCQDRGGPAPLAADAGARGRPGRGRDPAGSAGA